MKEEHYNKPIHSKENSAKRTVFSSNFEELTVTQKIRTINFLIKTFVKTRRPVYEVVLTLPLIIAEGLLLRLLLDPNKEDDDLYAPLIGVLTFVVYLVITRAAVVFTFDNTRKQMNGYVKNGQLQTIRRTAWKYGLIYYSFLIVIILVILYFLKLDNKL